MKLLKKRRALAQNRNVIIAVIAVVVIAVAAYYMTRPAEPVVPEEPEVPEVPEEPEVPEVTEVVIGAMYPFTGSAARFAADIKASIELAVDIINEEHPELDFQFADTAGLPGLNGAKIRIVWSDHQGDPEIARSEAERLIQNENVHAIIGCYASACAETSSTIAEQYGIPYIGDTVVAQSLTERGFEWFFRTNPTASYDGIRFEAFAEFNEMYDEDLNGENPGTDLHTWVLVRGSGLMDEQFGQSYKDYADLHGFELIEEIIVPEDTTRYDDIILRVKALNADIIMFPGGAEQAVEITREMQKLELEPPVLMFPKNYGNPVVIEGLGELADYMFYTYDWQLKLVETKPFAAQLNTMLEGRYEIGFTGFSSRSFTGMQCLADAINRAGSTDPEAIQAALRTTDIAGSDTIMQWEGIKFDENGQNMYGMPMFVQNLDGEQEIVYPLDVATAEPVIPFPIWNDR